MLGTKPGFVPMNSKIYLYNEKSDGTASQSYRSLGQIFLLQ